MQDTLFIKSLDTLEYFKIIEQVRACAGSEYAKTRISQLLPCHTVEEVQKAQRETSDARGLIQRRGAPSFQGLTDVTEEVRKADLGGTLSPKSLLQVAALLRMSRSLKDYHAEDNVPTCMDGYFDNLVENRRLENRIYDTILSEEEIADDASPALSDIRRKMRNAGQRVREVLNKIIHSQSYAKALQEPIISMRGDRYVVPVKAECRGQVAGLVHDSSASGQTVYIEPMAVVEANNELKVLTGEEKKEIERILSELSALVAAESGAIENNYRILAYLDFVFAKAVYSKKIRGVEPQINHEGRVDIRRGRHPLLEDDKVVPIDLYLGKEFDTLVITGPNTGGKTVALKTLGLFCAMACAGLHIPAADRSEIAVFDAVYADIGDEQSIEQSLSTFSSHMVTIVSILGSVSENCLVLFDELGAGTDPIEGAALAIAVIERIRQTGARIAATTHYSELKLFALTTDGVENASCEFDVESLRPTFKLLIGIPGKSNAFAISGKLGLPQEIIEAAKSKVNEENVDFEDVLTELEQDRQEMEKKRRQAEEDARTIEQLKGELKEKKEHYQKTRENAIRQAQLEAKRIVDQAKYAAERAMEEVEELRKAKLDEETKSRISGTKAMIREALKTADFHQQDPDALRRADVPHRHYHLQLGDTVTLLNLDKKAQVITLPDQNGNLTVLAGVVKLQVNERDIRTNEGMDKEAMKRDLASAVKYIKNADKLGRQVRTELDLRGEDPQSALLDVDKFIDDAVVMGLHVITIIHGKGTGRLRQSVHERLNSHPSVKSFRLGRYGEGENGVTIVELK